MSLLDRPDDLADVAGPRPRIETLLESGERLLDESRRLLNELNAAADGIAPRSPRADER